MHLELLEAGSNQLSPNGGTNGPYYHKNSFSIEMHIFILDIWLGLYSLWSNNPDLFMIKNPFSPSQANSLKRAPKYPWLNNLGQWNHVSACILSSWLGNRVGAISAHSTAHTKTSPTSLHQLMSTGTQSPFQSPTAPLPSMEARASPERGPREAAFPRRGGWVALRSTFNADRAHGFPD